MVAQAPLKDVVKLLESGQFAEAEAACRAVLTGDPENVMANGLWGYSAHKSGRSAEGEAALRRVAVHDTVPAQVPYLLGLLLAERGALDEASSFFSRARSPASRATYRPAWP